MENKDFISREEGAILVEKCINKDKKAQELFYNNYSRIVHSYTHKYYKGISEVSLRLYEYDDIYQHLWLCIWKKLPKFNKEKANIVTWLYMICFSECNLLYRNLKLHETRLYSEYYIDENEETHRYINYKSINDQINIKDDSIELLETLLDPSTAFENIVMGEMQIYSYVYILKDFITKMSRRQKQVYFHKIKGLKEIESAAILGISQSQINKIRKKIEYKALNIWDSLDEEDLDSKKVFEFAMELISNKSDEEICTKLNIELAVILICREILYISDLMTGVS